MTREEAIEELERLLSHWDELENGKRSFRWYSKTALEVALIALRPVSREQVEKVWRGEWIKDTPLGHRCKSCGCLVVGQTNFCPNCGAPMTDEAVKIVMERLNKLEETKK